MTASLQVVPGKKHHANHTVARFDEEPAELMDKLRRARFRLIMSTQAEFSMNIATELKNLFVNMLQASTADSWIIRSLELTLNDFVNGELPSEQYRIVADVMPENQFHPLTEQEVIAVAKLIMLRYVPKMNLPKTPPRTQEKTECE